MRTIEVVPIQNAYAESFHACLDSVCREGRYLAALEAPPLEAVREFVEGNVKNDVPQFVALDGERVVGWCDIVPKARDCFAHIGGLGMGVHRDYRRQGLGWRLLEATVAGARDVGLKRVELWVMTTNAGAITLYQRFGFAVEGVSPRGLQLGGAYHDLMLMGLWLAP